MHLVKSFVSISVLAMSALSLAVETSATVYNRNANPSQVGTGWLSGSYAYLNRGSSDITGTSSALAWAEDGALHAAATANVVQPVPGEAFIHAASADAKFTDRIKIGSSGPVTLTMKLALDGGITSTGKNLSWAEAGAAFYLYAPSFTGYVSYLQRESVGNIAETLTYTCVVPGGSVLDIAGTLHAGAVAQSTNASGSGSAAADLGNTAHFWINPSDPTVTVTSLSTGHSYVQAVPEPATFGVMALGLVAFLRKRKPVR